MELTYLRTAVKVGSLCTRLYDITVVVEINATIHDSIRSWHPDNLGCVRKVAQSRAERKPTVHKALPAAQSDPETGVYERPVQPLRKHRATLVTSRVRRCKHGGNI